jgi:hypothetical protein
MESVLEIRNGDKTVRVLARLKDVRDRGDGTTDVSCEILGVYDGDELISVEEWRRRQAVYMASLN